MPALEPSSASSSLRLAVLIVSWNGRADLEACLASLAADLAHPFPIDIFLVDNHSSDDSLAFVREKYPAVRITALSRNTGFAGGNNAGLEQILAENYTYAVLLNQDTVVTPGWLEALVETATQFPAAGAVQPLILLYKQPQIINTSGNPFHFFGFGYSGQVGENRDKAPGSAAAVAIPSASGACVLLRVSALRIVGLFDELFFSYNEDLDLSWRLRLAGYDILLAPQVVIYHNYDFKRYSSRKLYLVERNRLMLILKNYAPGTLLLISPMLFLFEIYMLLYAWKEGWLGLKLEAYREVWHNLPHIRAWRRKVSAFRRVSDRTMAGWMTPRLENDFHKSFLVRAGNFFLTLYWAVTRRMILW